MKKYVINLDLNPFILSCFKKDIHREIDAELMTELKPYLDKLWNNLTSRQMTQDKKNTFKEYQSKEQFIKLVHDFQSGRIFEKHLNVIKLFCYYYYFNYY